MTTKKLNILLHVGMCFSILGIICFLASLFISVKQEIVIGVPLSIYMIYFNFGLTILFNEFIKNNK